MNSDEIPQLIIPTMYALNRAPTQCQNPLREVDKPNGCGDLYVITLSVVLYVRYDGF